MLRAADCKKQDLTPREPAPGDHFISMNSS
jgi:hypothetical protein